MEVILCLDDNGGMMFNHRRQSRDRIVSEDILNICSGRPLYLNEYSAALFPVSDQLRISDDFLEIADENDVCFVEDRSLAGFEQKIRKLILYRWNRKYPADTYFDLSLQSPPWTLESTMDFQGSSHEKITREVYTR